MSEFSELVERLRAEQNADIESLLKPSPALEAEKKKLRLLYQAEGEPALARLREISSTEDFKAALSCVSLDLHAYIAEGRNMDLLNRFDTERNRFFSHYKNMEYQLETFPQVISGLREEDVAPSRYPDLRNNKAHEIARDLRCAGANVKEAAMHLASFMHLVTKLASAPRRTVEMFRPEGERINSDKVPKHNPTSAITTSAEDRVISV